MNNKSMRVEVVFAIRDARGLDANEKTFLFVVESRGAMSSKWQTAAEDMGMKKDTFYRTRHSLIEKELLEVHRAHNGTTTYRVNQTILCERTTFSVREQDSLCENENSLRPETKETKKKTIKETKKKNKVNVLREDEEYTPAQGPVDSQPSLDIADDTDSLRPLEVGESIKEEPVADSLTENGLQPNIFTNPADYKPLTREQIRAYMARKAG